MYLVYDFHWEFRFCFLYLISKFFLKIWLKFSSSFKSETELLQNALRMSWLNKYNEYVGLYLTCFCKFLWLLSKCCFCLHKFFGLIWRSLDTSMLAAIFWILDWSINWCFGSAQLCRLNYDCHFWTESLNKIIPWRFRCVHRLTLKLLSLQRIQTWLLFYRVLSCSKWNQWQDSF